MVEILYDVLGVNGSDVAMSDMIGYSVDVVNCAVIAVTILIAVIALAFIFNLRRR